MTDLRLDGEGHQAFLSMLDDAPESARYVEDEDVVTCQLETSLVEPKWIVQVTQLDRRMLSTQQLLAELQTGTLVKAETLVWRGGMEDWLPVMDVEGLPIAGLPMKREWLERRARGLPSDEGRRRSLLPSRLLATLPPAAMARRRQPGASRRPAPRSATPLLGLVASGALALATIFMTLYVLSKGGVFEAGDNQVSSPSTIRRTQAALSVAGEPRHGKKPGLTGEQSEPVMEAQAGN